jgi:hypothetical protein
VLGHRLLALRADVGDSAEDVELGHVAGCATPGDRVADRPIAVHSSLRPVLREAGDVDEIELLDAPVAHVVLVHEHDGAQTLEAAVAIVVRVDARVELVVRADRRQHQTSVARVDVVWERRQRELGVTGGGLKDALP